MDTYLQTIKEKSTNIGALINFITKRKEFLEFINQNTPTEILERQLSEKIYYLLNGIREPLCCDCGNHLKFMGFKNGYYKTCGDQKCVVELRKKTCLEIFGVDNPKKSKEVIAKEQEKIKEKWGGEHYLKNSEVRKKFNQSMTDKWGVEWASQSKVLKEKSIDSWMNNPRKKDIIEARRQKFVQKSESEKDEINEKKFKTIIEKWGTYEDYIEYVKNKIVQTSKERWGVDHHLKSKSVIKKRVMSYIKNINNKIITKLPPHTHYLDRNQNTNNTDCYINLKCDKCDEKFSITRQLLDKRFHSNSEICLICNPISVGTSQKEIDLFNFVKNNFDGQVINRYKFDDLEIDVFLPELNLGFELNGLFWHSDNFKSKDYHLSKTVKLSENNIRLIHIWEDDWDYNQHIVQSIILNHIGKTRNKIYARKCDIRQVETSEARNFLNENHLQGFVGSKIKLGLYYDSELVSMMTFGELRKPLGQSSVDNTFELLRFCNKVNMNVIGGASKLLQFFIKNWPVNKIISYADFSRSRGDMYQKIGFILTKQSTPNYYYVVDGRRRHRYNFRKDRLVKQGAESNLSESEIMKSRGINRIWDCGILKFEITI